MILRQTISPALRFGLVGAFFIAGDLSASSGPAQSGLFAFADNAITSATNPAGLTRIDNPEWLGQLAVFLTDSTFEKSTDQSSGALSADSDSVLIAPFVYYARPVGDSWGIGGSFTALGFGEDLGSEGPGRYLVDEWALAVLSLAPAVGYRVNEHFSLGAALRINYTYYRFESAVFNGPGMDDGRMEIEAGDLSLSGQLGLLYEFTDRTRIGLNWTAEDDPELSDSPEFSSGGGPVQEVTIKSITPQSLGAGVWHQFAGGSAFSFDAVWIEFSEFGVSEFRLNGNEVTAHEQDFEDVWIFTAGYWHPLNDKWTVKAGALYSTQFIKDVNRTQNFKMDQIFGIGVGAEYRSGGNKIVGLNLNFYDLGEAPVEVDIPNIGRFTGRYTKHQSIGLDFTLRWRRGAL